MRARTLACLALGAIALAAAVACDDAPTPVRCTDIPAGGCPLAHGRACDDPACEAIYACRPGNAWELAGTCPPGPPVADRDAGSGGEDGSAGPAFDASIDAPPGAYGGPGCETLQPPDCALGVVLGCGGCCGCEDVFVCEDEGWTLWASCGDGGLAR